MSCEDNDVDNCEEQSDEELKKPFSFWKFLPDRKIAFAYYAIFEKWLVDIPKNIVIGTAIVKNYFWKDEEQNNGICIDNNEYAGYDIES